MLHSVGSKSEVWSGRIRVETVQAGLGTLARLLQDAVLPQSDVEGVSSLCELLAEELGRACSEIAKAE